MSRRCSCGPGAPGNASRAGPVPVPGCTGSPPTPAWTPCAVTPAGPCPRRPRAPAGSGPSVAAMPWVQPYPDSLLDEVPADLPGPEAVAVSRETMSLAFLATLQLLPPRQRAVLILRDVVSWPAAEVAGLLDMSVPAVNSALQRARTTLRDRWPGGRLDWAPAAEPDPEQRRLLQRFIAAHEHADPEALIAVLRHDVRLAISQVGEWNGRPGGGRCAAGRHERPRPVAAAADHGQRAAGRSRVPPPSRRDRVRPVRPHRAAHRRRPPGRHRRLRAAIDVHRVRPARQP